jgi:hypothetical protein
MAMRRRCAALKNVTSTGEGGGAVAGPPRARWLVPIWCCALASQILQMPLCHAAPHSRPILTPVPCSNVSCARSRPESIYVARFLLSGGGGVF